MIGNVCPVRLEDLKLWRSTASYFSSDITVHSGFLDMYHIHRDAVIKYLFEVVAQYPSYEVRITGHSLGGALATIMALDVTLNYQLPNVKLMSFGSPRVGNYEFAVAFNRTSIQHYRLVNEKDPVPHFPQMVFGFHHAPQEVWQVDAPTGGGSEMSFDLCNLSGEDPTCSLGASLPLLIDDHHGYLDLPVSQSCTGDQDALSA
eukprot:TRINITY_DN2860_c0_g1_i2.p1 TRINITY_DN2860_c0_g1~~TRINITY_DN2860_c0_g1_i2.p1  ORF type:complete len:203 (-),score=59.85 TRINITY_DN2860_c0_g1_i2:588-1196(-)